MAFGKIGKKNKFKNAAMKYKKLSLKMEKSDEKSIGQKLISQLSIFLDQFLVKIEFWEIDLEIWKN